MLKPSTLRPALQSQCRAQVLRAARPLPNGSSARRTFASQPTRARATLNRGDLSRARRDYDSKKLAFLLAGAVSGMIGTVYTGIKLYESLGAEAEKERQKEAEEGKTSSTDSSKVQMDAPGVPNEQFKTEAGEKRKIVVHDEDGNVIVPTGNSTVPSFPLVMDLQLPNEQRPSNPIAASVSDHEGTAFTLVGLGTRTVTFLGIQVYVVGFYVATQDVERLQHYLVKKVNPLATTLIPSEKETLRKSLLDPTEGDETWNAILRDAGVRSAFRIIPVKDTDFHHLRDGFVRAITGRSQRDNKTYGDEQFGEALKNFKNLFNRGSVPKKRELLLCRDAEGRLSVLYNDAQDGKARSKKDVMGVVEDERISRLLWLNYLAGNKVASEGARQNIITGVMEFVERPVGTVATQVI